MEVIHRSHLARVCAGEVAGETVDTPMALSQGGAPLGIHKGDASAELRWGEYRVPLGPKLRPPISAGASEPPQKHGDGVVVLRLPLAKDLSALDGAELIVVENAFELRREPAMMAEALGSLRRHAGSRPLIYVPGLADPSNLALLCYMGVDVYDEELIRAMASRGLMLRPEGVLASDAAVPELEGINREEMAEERELVRAFIASGRLRELVDQRAASSPANTVALRTFDARCHDVAEEQTPVTGGMFRCNTPQSLHRPDVRRHRIRMAERYEAPKHKRVLVLLPCSARKPYHTSRSHRRFIEAIRSGPHFSLVHELILTSPLGLVPRELETFYPAAQYDIPVSGEWSSEELGMVNGMLRRYLAANHYDHVISHVGDGGLLTEGIDLIDTSHGDPGSSSSLAELDSTVRRLCSDYETVAAQQDRLGTVRSMLGYQFGRGVDRLLADASVSGKYPYWKIMEGREQIAMHTPDRGMASLTLEGAARLLEEGVNVVSCEDFQIKGGIFAVGVKDADPAIRIGDEVMVEQNGALAATGVAQACGRDMRDLDRGPAVKVRHKVR